MNGEYTTYLYGNATLRLLQQHVADDDKDPFFIHLPFQAVHGPLEAPQYIIDSFNSTIRDVNRQKKAAMITVLDYVVGELVDYLQSTESGNLWENTLIVFSTDNGG